MGYIVNTNDFKIDSFIPNKDDAPNSDILGNETLLDQLIDQTEVELLVELLGLKLATNTIEAIVRGFSNPGDEVYQKLVLGVESEGYPGLSVPLVAYIFYRFIKLDDSHYATAGVVRETVDTAALFESRPKAIDQYRKFYKYAIGGYFGGGRSFIKPSIFGNLQVVIWGGINYGKSNFVSVFEYIASHSEDYPDWNPAIVERNQNYFDI